MFTETTQLEDPRQEWRAIQEAMLRDYLQTAQDVLEVCKLKKQLIINIHLFEPRARARASDLSLKIPFVKAELIR